MPIYTVEIDGKQYDLEGDHPPSEAEARSAVGAYSQPKQATPPPASATIGMLQPSPMAGYPKQSLADRLLHGPQVIDPQSGEPIQVMGDPGIIADASVGGASLGSIAKGAKGIPGVIARVAGVSKARAGANMEAALEAGKDLRVPLNQGATDAAMRARDLVGSKNSELNAFLDRLTNPKVTQYRGDDLAVREAQDFVSKFGAMSADDASKIPPMALKEFKQLAVELRAALTSTLDTVGKGEQYTQGVGEYRRVKQVADMWEKARPWLKRMGYAAAGGAGYKGLTSGASQ